MVTARFLLDRDALSECLKGSPHRPFAARLGQHRFSLAIAATTWQEALFGLGLMPRGKRRDVIEEALIKVIEPSVDVLPYDKEAAAWHGRERARLQLAGKVAPYADGEIAAVAVRNDLTLVTNNVRHFKAFRDLRVVNWMR